MTNIINQFVIIVLYYVYNHIHFDFNNAANSSQEQINNYIILYTCINVNEDRVFGVTLLLANYECHEHISCCYSMWIQSNFENYNNSITLHVNGVAVG